MTAGQLSASLVGRLLSPSSSKALPGYYRSKLFIDPYTTNAIVAAASPLLSLLDRLCVSPVLPPIEKIHENIQHELLSFRSRLEGKTHSEEWNVIAHYLLCATIDELLGKSYLRLYNKSATFVAFTPPSYDGIGPEVRFFEIIDHLKERPSQYLDVIELAYYCLIVGFEGKAHQQVSGRQLLDNLLEELFQLIQTYRTNRTHCLFKKTKKLELPVKNYMPLMVVSFLSLSVLISAYALHYVLLGNQAKKVLLGDPMIAQLGD